MDAQETEFFSMCPVNHEFDPATVTAPPSEPDRDAEGRPKKFLTIREQERGKPSGMKRSGIGRIRSGGSGDGKRGSRDCFGQK